jgi:hypothetical protein
VNLCAVAEIGLECARDAASPSNMRSSTRTGGAR